MTSSPSQHWLAKIYFTLKLGLKDMDYIRVNQDMVHWQAFVKTVMNQ
jgi:hypothetical protein